MTRILHALVCWQDQALAWWRCRSGHTDTLVMTSTRIYLQCATCGRQTPGWFVCLSRDRAVTTRVS